MYAVIMFNRELRLITEPGSALLPGQQKTVEISEDIVIIVVTDDHGSEKCF